MSYTTDDTSIAGGLPVELYTFTTPNEVYRYTSHYADVTYDSDVYTAIATERGALRFSTTDDPLTVDVEVPYDLDVVAAFAFGVAPRSCVVTIRRYHTNSGAGAGINYFTGDLSGISIRGSVATLTLTAIVERMKVPVPNVYWQRSCNHRLFDQRCRVFESSFTVPASVVVSIDSAQTGITVSTIDGIPAVGGSTATDYLKGGTLTRIADGERRLIVTNNTNPVVTVARPFPTLEAGDALKITAGCDHTAATCLSKFSNTQRFGGHPGLLRRTLFGDLTRLFYTGG